MEGERERDPGQAIKTKDTWGEAPGRQEKQKHKAEGPCGGAERERGGDSPREGQNDGQGQGHRPKAKAGERGGRGEGHGDGAGTEKKRHTKPERPRETERTGLGRAGTARVEERGQRQTDRSWYGRLIAPSACHMLDLLRVLTASSWQPRDSSE